MKLAHLILAHNNPPQLERLIKRLMCPGTDIYIHLDSKSDISKFIHLRTLDNVFFISNRTDITWANYSMMRATLNSFAEILQKGESYSHINLLSGQDYPLKSAAEIQNFLFENADKTFMKYLSIFDEWQESRSRITRYSMGDYKLPLKFKIQKVLNRFLSDRKMPLGLKPYGFSQWLTITPDCALYVMNYLKRHPSVKRFFRATWGVDELVFQTILINSHLKDKIVNDHLRYIKFSKGASRPKTLTMEDLEMMVDSDKFYARKFDPANTDVLDYLDALAEGKKNKKSENIIEFN